MKAHNGTDQLVHPITPAVTFATDAAAQSVTAPIKERYDQAAAFAFAEWAQADRCDADMNGWRQEIAESERRIAEEKQRVAEREQWIQRRTLDRQQHIVHAQQAVDVANPNAIFLSMSGIEAPQVVRPLPSLDLVAQPVTDPSPTGVQAADPLERFNAFHTEYTTANPEPEL